MTDLYLHDYDNVSTIVGSLKSTKETYEEKKQEIKKLVNDITISPAWVDAELKTAFVNCCEQYLTLYDRITTNMTGYIDYLEKKSEAAYELEAAYSKRG